MPTTAKEQMVEVINSQPMDASYDEIMRGLDDSRQQRTISNQDMLQRILAWQQ
jgi:hypothetical protein